MLILNRLDYVVFIVVAIVNYGGCCSLTNVAKLIFAGNIHAVSNLCSMWKARINEWQLFSLSVYFKCQSQIRLSLGCFHIMCQWVAVMLSSLLKNMSFYLRYFMTLILSIVTIEVLVSILFTHYWRLALWSYHHINILSRYLIIYTKRPIV